MKMINTKDGVESRKKGTMPSCDHNVYPDKAYASNGPKTSRLFPSGMEKVPVEGVRTPEISGTKKSSAMERAANDRSIYG